MALTGGELDVVAADPPCPGLVRQQVAYRVRRDTAILQPYGQRTVLGGISPAWTLAIEVSFYLVLPLYAQWQRAGYRATLLVPSYYYQEGLRDDGTPDGTYRRFVPSNR